MGTEVAPKMYLPGCYTIKDLENNVGNGSWTVPQESRTSKTRQYYETFLARPPIDGYMGYDKEQLRQTILKQESMFKYQLQELHRLYKRQKDLMNEIKGKELCEHPIPAAISLSSLFSSRMSSEDAKSTWHIPNFPTVDSTCCRPSRSGTESTKSPLSLMKGKMMQTGVAPNQTEVTLNDYTCDESKCKKFPRRLFDLELPADKYIDNEEEQLEERVVKLSRGEVYPPNMNYEIACRREINFSLSRGMDSGINGNVTSNLYLPNNGLANLNEHAKVKEASTSASVDILGNIACSKENIQGWNSLPNSNSVFHCLGKESSWNPQKGMDGGVCFNNLHLQNENLKEWLSYSSQAEQSRKGNGSVEGCFLPEDLSTSKSLQVLPQKDHGTSAFLPSNQSTSEPRRKKTIFGVELPERNHDVSVMSSDTPALVLPVHQSFQPPPVTSWSKLPNNWSQNLLSVQERPCINGFAPSTRMSKTMIQSPEFVEERLHVNRNSWLNPGFSVELSSQNDGCLGSQMESKELHVGCPSSAFDYLFGIPRNNSTSEQFAPHGPLNDCKVLSCTDLNSAKDMNVDEVKGKRKYEKTQLDLPWLTKPLCNGESSNKMVALYNMKLDSLQNYPELFSKKTEMVKDSSEGFIQDSISAPRDAQIELGDSLSVRKILGVPIFDKTHSFKDPTSFSCAKPSVPSSLNNDNIVKVGLFSTDLACDAVPLKPGEQFKVEDLVEEKVRDSCSAGFRHQIDLNLSLFEEAPSRPCSPTSNVKMAAGIDLEVPFILETEQGISPAGESTGIELQRSSESWEDDFGEPHERLIQIAAETIIYISSSRMHNLLDDGTCHPSEAPQKDPLHWFAEVISSYKGDAENQVGAVLMGKNGASHKDSFPDKIDYFEFMTLRFTETNVDEYYCKPQASEDQKVEEKLQRRPRRGQARRGRQRKDFQRDVLPGLVSLSRHEVTDDLQVIEGMIRATGGTWQSSFTKRNAAKNGSGRGRRRSGSIARTPTVSAVCPPPVQQSIFKEAGLEEQSLTGWGKRTRRPPRYRYINNPALLSK